MAERVAVLGAGNFGTVIANLLAENGCAVKLWLRDEEKAKEINEKRENQRYLPGVALHAGITATVDLADVLSSCQLLFLAMPSHSVRDFCRQNRALLSAEHQLISTVKGIDDDFSLISEIIHQETPVTQIGVMSGPNLASEIAAKMPTATVIASRHSAVCRQVQQVLASSYFRVYHSSDLFSVELGGALKNIYAIAAGIATALGVGENTRALLMTRSLAEMSRFASHLGGQPITFLGLAGVGDLIATCSSRLSRNFRVGYAIGQGQNLEQTVKELGQTAEGVRTVKLVVDQANKLGIYMPIAEGLYEILFQNAVIGDVIQRLMTSEHQSDVEFL